MDVKNQAHYTQFIIQPIEFIMNNNLSFAQGSAIKYICRYNKKDGIKDLEKAKVYIDYMIEQEKNGFVEAI